jgi:hypothetical protein
MQGEVHLEGFPCKLNNWRVQQDAEM